SGCPSELSCSLNISNAVYGVGTISANYSTPGNENYSATSTTFIVTINPIASEVNVTLDYNQTNISISVDSTIDLNCTIITGESSAYLVMYRDEILINNGTSPIGNTTTFNTVQIENITCIYSSSQNYTSSSDTWWVNVTSPASAPTITRVWNWSSAVTPNDGPSNTNLTINFSVTDANGIADLVNDSVMINISNSGIGRINNTACVQFQGFGNDANYTCNVTMWWWDSDGVWIVNVSLKDSSDLWASNDSTNITINMVTGFVSGPGNLTFGTLEPGTTNQTPTNWITLNNTGNQDINYNTLQINATNLIGETISTLGLWAANFSLGNLTGAAKPECDSSNKTAQNMTSSEYTTIVGAILPSGNFSINNNVTGQEILYICIRKVGLELGQQQYSTFNEGAWTIRILLVALTYRKRKKINKNNKLVKALNILSEELKEDYSEEKEKIIRLLILEIKKKYSLNNKELSDLIDLKLEIEIPIGIFVNKLGALESISKYMKENLNMDYCEIAKLLNRNERTIWTACKKASEKQKKLVFNKKSNLLLPISIFDNKLTILENVIVYLRKIKMRYNEIAEFIERDQRNIWTIYSRAMKKLDNKNI
ncbi:MAG: hypothetical protein ABH811_00560, partial [archaeon]